MASVRKVGPFLGINNRLPENQLLRREAGRVSGAFLRNAVNVDLTDVGSIKRRQGVTLVQGGGECHSLWSDGEQGYYVDGSVLYRFPRTQLAPVISNRPVSFTLVAGQVVWTDGVSINKIDNGVSMPLTQPDPNPIPNISITATGSLAEGMYLVSFVAVGASGYSAPSAATSLNVPHNGRVTITSPGGATRVFLSGPNEQELFFCGVADSVLDIPILTEGQMLTTRHYRPTPPGDIVRYYKGRLLVASGGVLFYSQPYAPTLYDPTRGYIPFTSAITMLAPVQNGVYISAGRTYFLAGDDIEKSEAVEKLPFSAVFGTDTYSEHDDSVWWYSEHGTVRGLPGGEVEIVNFDNVVPTTAQAGASIYREQDGMRQVISSLAEGGFPRAAASSFIDAEIVRKERT